ncbi:Protein of unknown function DUF2201, metallopeptidase-related [Geobacter metallireducens RCH3]|uniref:Metal-dependent peptidase n=1 Tax=Geobacter metallireducens (strain ATCC 53774 / DSM 7210 / GS-15) TaxID=269799 RepID=Q39YT7_GEOMG|nr:VWA-like domain-containing protein [Geobacter metallireducens]ABB30587.1 protein of unknown function DUF2201, VWFA superfamily [Geobacter metallireducens GS-15]EHP87973.1 Protein of unknown function DUF2201, metallopeptidase-related [Geobacter metallireducens RCH3]
MPKRNIENAIVRMLKRKPFYGRFLLGLRREGGNGGHPLGVTVRDGVPTLAVNAPLFGAEPPQVQEGLLEHTIKHLIHLHMFRRKGRNNHDWDLACDLAINPSIEHLPADALLPRAFKLEEGLAAEEYYALLVDPFDTGSLKGYGTGNASRDSGGKKESGEDEEQSVATVDDHAIWDDADATPVRLAEEVVRGMVRDAYRACDGEVPADIRQVVAGMLAPSPIPWRQVLRQFVATAGRTGRQTTWMKEHRRFVHITPGTRKMRRLNLLIGIDVSDSTNSVELREAFAQELVRISRGRESTITVLYANSRIQRIDAFRGVASVVEIYEGGGFTDLRPVFSFARTMHPLPAAVIYLTDGIGPVPEPMEFPTLWVLTRDGEKPAPWGAEVRLEV